MCSHDEGPRTTETSHFLIKSFELMCHAHIFDYYAYIYIYVYIRSIFRVLDMKF